ncbi:23S rRNA (uracil(1939)-C(5))-methyltransferase RlmD [Mycoplasma sp. ES3225-GEN-MYC]|uniref:23S rRNA (Uracil(1939)-C(5))-methyltransferase RlmD n=1 Tax=Mycoplasma miroungigenitalium TaxID=754515 RepID=A0A6M4JB40_9MOLU|nr:23S rRNA (uracil(1939)-C(5))-methyltransferase RlmD [Mycoplasma miroungigenitalium]MBU4691778.1 23S rRNA (uracil(1939)-C(5))-methyltransferase RlmD [Mycoplasma miroungigenitalium]QJR43605.1 23S rRNA (uracil(1939)-C(5))-methyltransferase RlmD [Mycoplasma miroungigenitalium]
MKLKAGEILDNVKAIMLSYEGMGVVKINDYSIFVENLLVDETANIVIKKANTKFAFAKVLKHITISPKRIKPDNEKLMESGSTPIAMLSYKDQLLFKEEFVKYLFGRNIHFENVAEILPNPKPWGYRNKITVFCDEINGKFVLGLFEKNTHNLIEQTSYDLAHPKLNEVILWLDNNINNYQSLKNSVNNINSFTFRYSEASEEGLIIINANKMLKIDNKLITDITNKFNWIVNIIVNLESKNSNKYFALLDSKTSILDKIDSLSFNLEWNSFFQINSAQTNNLYNLLINNLDLNKNDIVVDAYSGVGTIALKIAPFVKTVYGLEIINEAVMNARDNAKLNNIENALFYSGDVNKTIFKIEQNPNVIIVDPPRSGISTQFLETIIKINPEKIGYISCNVHTMCRDIDYLRNNGYQLIYLRPCDMFSQTHHIECVGVLIRK